MLNNQEKVIKKLQSTGGWRLRQDVKALVEEARMSLSASQSHFDDKEWESVLLEIEDAQNAMQKLQSTLNDVK